MDSCDPGGLSEHFISKERKKNVADSLKTLQQIKYILKMRKDTKKFKAMKV